MRGIMSGMHQRLKPFAVVVLFFISWQFLGVPTYIAWAAEPAKRVEKRVEVPAAIPNAQLVITSPV
jgi:hypothetical protein